MLPRRIKKYLSSWIFLKVDNNMDKIKSKESESQKILDFKDDVTFLRVPIKPPPACEILLMSGWKVINVDNQNNQVTLSKGFLNV